MNNRPALPDWRRFWHSRQQWRLSAAAALLLVLAMPPVRQFLETSMTRHMLVQFPLLAFSGFLLAGTLSRPFVERINRWNDYGITGLFATALLLALLMIPRVLDLALIDVRIEITKWLALLASGVALRLSWQPAGWLLQGFFLGNVLPMTAVVGYLFESSPVRVCNAYLLDDQAWLGQGLEWLSGIVAAAWFACLLRALMHKEAAALEASSHTESTTP